MVHGSSELRLAVIRRRVKVAALLAKGVSNQYTILAQLGMEPGQQPTISRDIRVIYRWWQMKIARKYDTHVALMVAQLNRILDELWEAWERSKQPRESSRSRTGERGKSAELRREQRDGNPAFMELIIKTIGKLCDLLDLNPAKRVMHGGDAGAPPIQHEHAGQVRIDLSKLGEPEIIALRQIRAKLMAPKENNSW